MIFSPPPCLTACIFLSNTCFLIWSALFCFAFIAGSSFGCSSFISLICSVPFHTPFDTTGLICAGPKIQKGIEQGAENATKTAVAGSEKISKNLSKGLSKGVGKAALYTGAAVIGTKLASKAIDRVLPDKKKKKKTVKEDKSPAWQRKEGKSESGGLNKKGVASYRAANPGSKLKTAVTTKPSKLKKGSKAANRRKSFCSRMKGMKAKLTSAKTARDPDSRINKSLRKWNC